MSTAIAAALACVAFASCVSEKVPTPAIPTASGATGALGVVVVDHTFANDQAGFSVTIEEANTVWVPALDRATGDDRPGARMVGVRTSIDTTGMPAAGKKPVPYVGDGGFVALWSPQTGPDGQAIARCFSPWLDEAHAAVARKILAAIGGDAPFAMDHPVGTGQGWVVCYTASGDDRLFDGPGYTIALNELALIDDNSAPATADSRSSIVVRP